MKDLVKLQISDHFLNWAFSGARQKSGKYLIYITN